MNSKSKSKLTTILLGLGVLVLCAGGALAATLPSMSGDDAATVTAKMAAQTVTDPAGTTATATAPAPATSAPTGTTSTPTTAAPPTTSSSTEATPAPSTSSSSRTVAQARKRSAAQRARKARAARRAAARSSSITYTVKTGDTLSGIAAWFKYHGYGSLYAANRDVIGRDPDLIFPGQRITITRRGVMTLAEEAQ